MRIFQRVRLPLVVATVSAACFVGWQAIADRGPGHEEHGEKGHHERHDAEHRDGGMGHGHHDGHRMGGHDNDEDDDDADAGPVHITRSPEQAARHAQMVARERDKLRDWTHKRRRHLTLAERQAMGMHWRHVIRLERIREIAEQEKDTATVKKCDELLERENKKFDARLAKLASEEVGAKSGSTSDGGAR